MSSESPSRLMGTETGVLTNLDIHRNLMIPLNEGGEYHEKIIKLDEESVYFSFEKSARQYLSVTSII